MAVELIYDESLSDEDRSVNDTVQQSSQATTVKVESSSTTDHVTESQSQNEPKTFAESNKVFNQDIQNDTHGSIIIGNSDIEAHDDDLLSNEERLCDTQISIEETGDDMKELIADEEEFCDAHSNIKESSNSETDPGSDEEEFCDAQSSF